MSRPILRLTFALLLCLAAALRGGTPIPSGTVKVPPDKPVFTVEVPESWKAEYMEGSGVLGLDAKDDSASMSIGPAAGGGGAAITEETAKAALLKEALATWSGATNTEPTELTVAGHKAFYTKMTTALGDVEYTIFTPDGKNFFMIGVTKGNAKVIVDSIKAIG
jgi:hypothetical protein